MRPSSSPAVPRSVDRRPSLARAGEQLAARMCEDLGMIVVARNWRCPGGELDLVLIDGQVLVVCEVKTRRGQRYGHPLEAITPTKLARLRRLAAECARDLGLHGLGLRLDVMGIVWPVGAQPRVRHLQGVG